MDNELAINTQSIIVTKGLVKFTEYEKIKKQAETLAEQIKTVKVDEENIKQSKKLLAAVNKRVKELEDKRIEVKKTMLEPYVEFENQVKEIVGIVKEADNVVRDQVRFLEEQDRQQKEAALEDIFNKRKKHYILGDLVEFEHFLKPKHLNKTTSIEAVEKEIIALLEKTSMDFKVMEAMPEVKEILEAYLGTYDLAAAINYVNEQKQRQKQLEASKAMQKAKAAAVTTVYHIAIFDEKDFKLLKMFMEQNGITYEVDKAEVL